MMSTSRTQAKLLPFDAARYLPDENAIAEYMAVVLETGDTNLLPLALSDIARARGVKFSAHPA